MLHILLFILKIIGIILAVILGVLVLLICVVLFVPVEYRAKGECRGIREINGMVHVRWLFGLLRASAVYKDHKLDYIFCIAWKKISNHDDGKEKDEDEIHDEKIDPQSKDEKMDSKKADAQEDSENNERDDERSGESKENDKEESCLHQIYEKDVEKVPQIYEEKRHEDVENEYQSDEEENRTGFLVFRTIREKYEKIIDKIKTICRNIKCTRDRLYDKIKEISDKKDVVSDFISDETHRKAFEKLINEGLVLIKRIKPGKLELDMEYGFGDPSLTGRSLALFSMIYPFLGGDLRITPDFQNQKLNGRCLVQGRIYVWYFVFAAVRLLLSKYIRRSYKDISQLQL